MSDEHKPHDDHGHDAGHTPADHGHADHGHEAHPAAAPDHAADHAGEPAHQTPDAHADAHGHDAHPADAHAHDADAHEAHAHGDHGHAPEAHAEPAHAAHAADEPHAAHAEPAHDPAPAHHDHAVEAAAATAAAAASASAKKPVWSDSGDAPFEDVDSTPVYARGKGKKSGKGGGNETVEIIKTIVFALLIALVLRVFLFQPFTIPSASMEPNLYEGDYIVVSKWSYGYSKHSIPFSPPLFEGRVLGQSPERGDIAVFKLPRDNKTDYIKRVIGLPGDRVQMVNNLLHINGEPVKDVVISEADATNMFGMPQIQARETLPGGKSFTIQDFGPGNNADDTPVFEVPAGMYFMMGDNRDNSVDSRFDASQNGVGMVPEENLIGKAEIILFSWSPGASLWNPVSWFSKIRPSRFFTVLN